jgi:hypothetical protein
MSHVILIAQVYPMVLLKNGFEFKFPPQRSH